MTTPKKHRQIAGLLMIVVGVTVALLAVAAPPAPFVRFGLFFGVPFAVGGLLVYVISRYV